MIPNDFLMRFTTHLKQALKHALDFTLESHRELVEPGDLIVGLLREKGAVGGELFLKNGITVKIAERFFQGTAASQGTIAPDLTDVVKSILERCVVIAHQYQHKYVGTEHIAAAILEEPGEDLVLFFRQTGVSLSSLRDQVQLILTSNSRIPELSAAESTEPEPNTSAPQPETPAAKTTPQNPQRAPRTSAIEAFTRELTRPEVANALDPVIGRESELDRMVQILCRRTKNNPILLGEPGVGKTAIVEGFAKLLASGDVPDALHGKRLLNLDLTLIVAGTMYRGEFEARLKQIMDEVRADPNVILFIDEIHNIVGAGSTSGSLDAANILKPALARGEIRCIGATTWAEFKKHIEPDAALERRFQPITIDEPTVEAARTMLDGVKEFYAKHHQVRYAADVPEATIRLAERFLTDRFFPDKAIDLLDEAAASVIARRVSKERMERLSSMEALIRQLETQMSEAIQARKLADADVIQQKLNELQKQRETFQKKMASDRAKSKPLVTAQDVARVVARMTGAELSTVLATERERLQKLPDQFRVHLVGQDAALTSVAQAIAKARLGLGDPKRPRASFLFVGPSGTGKTELARLLAKQLFGRADALVKLDMTEFSEGHSVSKLIGAPAGYVGYREANKLTDAIRKRPHCVILFDEFEKAHSDVQNTLLQLLEDGQLSDGSGRPISFRHAFLVLTSNVGSEGLSAKSLGFGASNQDHHGRVSEALKERFRPELLNRLDQIVVFNPLAKEHLQSILDRELTELKNRLAETQEVTCRIGNDVRDWLLSQPLPPEEGARAIRRLIDRELISVISRVLTANPSKQTLTIKATAQGLQGK